MLHVNHASLCRHWLKNRRFVFTLAAVLLLTVLGTLMASAAREVDVYYEGDVYTVATYSDDPAVILQQAGLAVPEDGEYALEETEEGLVLRVSPLLRVTVTADNSRRVTTIRTDRVSSLLRRLGIRLGAYDTVTPAKSAILTADTTVQVQRVTFARASHEEAVAPGVTFLKTDALKLGDVAVQSEGVPGLQRVYTHDRLVDGRVTQSRVIDREVVRAPKNKVILQGTAKVAPTGAAVTTNAKLNQSIVSPLTPDRLIALDENGAPLQYEYCIKGPATAYYAPEGAHTSTGEIAQIGYVAVDPKEIPYGSKMYIRTADGSFIYGYAKAADTGGFIRGEVEVDLYFPTLYECTCFGRRNVEIYVLETPDQ